MMSSYKISGKQEMDCYLIIACSSRFILFTAHRSLVQKRYAH